MPRKFRLSVHRKNEFRKKRVIKCAIKSTLFVSLPLSSFTDNPAPTIEVLQKRIKEVLVFPDGWTCISEQTQVTDRVVLSKMELHEETVTVTRTLTILNNFEWFVSVFGHKLPTSLAEFPGKISTIAGLQEVLWYLDSCVVCIGNSDQRFVCLSDERKGVFMDSSGSKKSAFCDDRFTSSNTIRTSSCVVLFSPKDPHTDSRCCSCHGYRKTLNSMLFRHKKCDRGSTELSSHTNYRYFNTPEKVNRLEKLHKHARTSQQRIKRLKKKIASIVEDKGVEVDKEIHEDLSSIMKENSPKVTEAYPADSFARIFWEQQLKASAVKDARSMKWEPMMIRWCLYLRHLSSRAYETLRDSGAVKLPSQRTLRDYTHYTKASYGFSSAVDEQLMDMASVKTCHEREKYIIILMDEMHVKENLVYDKHTGSLIGYTELSDINTHLERFEKSIEGGDSENEGESITGGVLANSMLVLMVRGLFSQLKFPYVQFPCSSLCGDQMYEPFWEAVCRLERCSFKVLALTCDGLSANRRLFQLHNSKEALTHKILNPYADDGRFVYFFSDPPHLVKTTRNGWANKCRHLWCNGKSISWSHLCDLYERCQPMKASPGLTLLPKLKFEHISLTNFSKMRVDLAAQVLSSSVSKALTHVFGDKVRETAKFADMFDKFFDSLNVSHLRLGQLKRCAFKAPYHSALDFRLKWLQETFIPYLDSWEADARKRDGSFTKKEREMMLLSHETRTGLRLTVLSFVELVKYVFTIPGVTVFLSNRICQDPLEGFFGQQRQRGRVNENPSVHQFVENTRALRVINGACRQIRGNCRGSLKRKGPEVDNSLLPKRKIKHK